MNGFRVDIKQLIVKFSKREKLFSYQIKGDIYKTRFIEIRYNGYRQSLILKLMIMFFSSSTSLLLLLIAVSPTFSLPIKLDNLSRRYKRNNSQISA